MHHVKVSVHLEPMSRLLGTKLVVTSYVVESQWLPHHGVSQPSEVTSACSVQPTMRCASPRCHLLGLLAPRAGSKSPCASQKVAWPRALRTQEDKSCSRVLNSTCGTKDPGSQCCRWRGVSPPGSHLPKQGGPSGVSTAGGPQCEPEGPVTIVHVLTWEEGPP